MNDHCCFGPKVVVGFIGYILKMGCINLNGSLEVPTFRFAGKHILPLRGLVV